MIQLLFLLPMVFSYDPTAKAFRRFEVERLIIYSDTMNYQQETGRPCACPGDGRNCNGRSAYDKDGGYEPRCYYWNITDADIEAYELLWPL